MTTTTADFVIVGAGSAGCVLAARLSEDARASVLLVEAGGPGDSPLVRIPIAYHRAFGTRFDWAFHTAPQKHLGGRALYYPRGRGLGGCSLINALIYARGHPSDYDAWRDAGCPGWGWADVEPAFRRAEPPDGPMAVERPREVNPLSEAFVAAAAECGFPVNDDFNGPTQDGFGFYRRTQRGGRRHSVAAAYLAPARSRTNLTVVRAHARRVTFAAGRAVGVECQDGPARVTFAARRGVILSAGAVQTPQLLLNSGVGPGGRVADAPGVGENLHDHACVGVGYHCTKPVSLLAAKGWWPLVRYALTGRGPLASNVAEAGGFVRTRPGLPAPDVQFHFLPVHVIDHGRVEPRGHGFAIAPTVLRPLSRGRVTVNPDDPFGPPVIDPGYLADPFDVLGFVEGVRLARRLAAAPAFDPYRGPEAYPGPKAADDAAITAYVRATLQTLYHPAGTCRMGSDVGAVLTPRLAVRGVGRLWVADASVMPTPVGANTNATVVMVAERAADLVRADA